MSWTKRDIIVAAFESIGLAGYVFDLQPEQLETARRKLDAMMAMWNSVGIRVGYPLVSTPDSSDLDDKTEVTDMGVEAIYTNLAKRIAPGYGKTVPQEILTVANEAYLALLATAAGQPIERQLAGSYPLGAGNKSSRYNQNFTTSPDPTLDAGTDTYIEFNP